MCRVVWERLAATRDFVDTRREPLPGKPDGAQSRVCTVLRARLDSNQGPRNYEEAAADTVTCGLPDGYAETASAETVSVRWFDVASVALVLPTSSGSNVGSGRSLGSRCT